MLKKLLVLLTALALILSALAGCSAKDDSADGAGTDAEINTETESETGTDTGTAEEPVDLTHYSDGLNLDGYFEGIKASDYVTLPQYKDLKYPESTLTVTDEALQAQLDYIVTNNTTNEQITDRALEDGDTINIDYIGYIDGVEFSGGNTNGTGAEVTIGVTNYIDDFLEQLIGHMPGENFDIEVTFPDNYGKEELNGKDAVFNVTINYIVGDEVAPELNDEFAVSCGFSSLEDLIIYVKEMIIEDQKTDFAVSVIESGVCSEIPEQVYNHFVNIETLYAKYNAAYYGVDLDTYAMYALGAESFDAYIESMDADFTANAAKALVAQAIAEAEGIVASSDDVVYSGLDSYIDTYGEPYLRWYSLSGDIIPQLILSTCSE